MSGIGPALPSSPVTWCCWTIRPCARTCAAGNVSTFPVLKLWRSFKNRGRTCGPLRCDLDPAVGGYRNGRQSVVGDTDAETRAGAAGADLNDTVRGDVYPHRTA